MNELLTVIATWISLTTGLPPAEQHPTVVFVPEAGLSEVRATLAASATGKPAAPVAQGAVHGFYDDASGAIYLPKGWSAASALDVSLLVHEMVHHLQRVSGTSYPCPQAREAPAYEAQKAWLAGFGIDMMEAFELDPMTMLLRTRCM